MVLMALCVSLCGCQRLEDMKSMHAKMDASGNISWNGHTYVPVRGSYEGELNLDSSDAVYVTAEDVPVLLSQLEGKCYGLHAGGYLLSSDYYDNLTDRYVESYYCRADVAELVKKGLSEGPVYTSYRLSFWDDYAWQQGEYLLSAQQQEAVKTVLNTVTPFAIYGGYDQTDTAAQLMACSDYDVFRSMVGYLDKSFGRYYIVIENYNEYAQWSSDCYDVPDSLTAVFDEIYKAKEEAYNPDRHTVYEDEPVYW